MKLKFAIVFFCLVLIPLKIHGNGDMDPNAPDPRTDRLCAESAAPDDAPDKVHINCRLETGEFAPAPAAPASYTPEIVVVAYNMERGMKLDEQIRLFKEGPNFRDADVLLVSEVDRG